MTGGFKLMEANNVRLDLFKDIRSSIRGSDDYVIVGVDVAKNKHHAFFGTPRGKTLRKDLVFDNCIVGFESLRNFVRDLQVQFGLRRAVYGLEPTASYHKPLAEYLIRHGETVVYVSNVAVKNNRSLLDGRWDKNDNSTFAAVKY
jgi:transposase